MHFGSKLLQTTLSQSNSKNFTIFDFLMDSIEGTFKVKNATDCKIIMLKLQNKHFLVLPKGGILSFKLLVKNVCV
jgi:hypothetical protein